MKILTWNINGIRASKRSVKDVLASLNSDIVCLQETKITRDMLDEPSAIVDGYNSYFSFGHKKGYSGTANFCRDSVTPVAAEEGLSGELMAGSGTKGFIGCPPSIEEFEMEELINLDREGRAIITQHKIRLEDGVEKDLAVINVYVPSLSMGGEERWRYKLRFLALLQSRAESLLRHGRHVIVLGDMNITHKRIDHCDPSTQEYLRADSRLWMDQLLRPVDRDPDLASVEDKSHSFPAILPDAEGGRFIDAFRFFHPDKQEAYSHWSTLTAARQTNYGKRLDYIFVDTGLQDYLVDCHMLPQVEGSDHCPVVLELKCMPLSAMKCPPLCSRFMPEFQGKQQNLFRFFSISNSVKSEDDVRTEDLSQNREPDCSSKEEGNEVLRLDSTCSVNNPEAVSVHSSQSNDDLMSLQKRNLKRTLSDKPSCSSPKKKTAKNSSVVGIKQASLFNFFQKPPASDKIQDKTEEDSVTKSKYWQETQGNEEDTKPSSTDENDSRSPPITCTNGTAVVTDSKTLPDSSQRKADASSLWKGLLAGPPPPPPCKGHKEACVLRTVKKEGPNKGKQFYVCARPEGLATNKEARCDHFQWVTYMPAGKKTKR